MRDEAAFLLDRLLGRVARGKSALDVAIGEGLAALDEGDRLLKLGYSCLGDYARERLGLGEGTARNMARRARELRTRPVLRAAVWRGEVSARKALAVLPVARGELEEAWVARARTETVRALEAAVRKAVAISSNHAGGEDDSPWERVWVPLTANGRAKLDEAMALAGKLLGAASPKWQRLEAICQEYLGAHPVEPSCDAARGGFGEPVQRWFEAAKEALEVEMGRWAFLDEVAKQEPVAAPDGAADESDPRRVDEELKRLAAMREGWDELLGHLAMLLLNIGLWRDMGFADFSHYCAERLGMAARTVEQRAWLARRLYALPALRMAMREGRVSYEKARLVASVADDRSLAGLIERAERSTCLALRREIEAREETQMCARTELHLRVPGRVAALLGAAFQAVREAEGRWLTPGECLERLAEHFIATWREALTERSTPHRRVLARDGGLCQVPGCSRAAAHAHHVRFRSAGGSDAEENLISTCAAHHLHGVHLGWIRVRGEAPDRLQWELGMRTPSGPLALA